MRGDQVVEVRGRAAVHRLQRRPAQPDRDQQDREHQGGQRDQHQRREAGAALAPGAAGGRGGHARQVPAARPFTHPQNPNMFGYTGQVTLAGYDNMTGIGTPAGAAFLSGLRASG